jgi:hypothetical protein
MQTPSGPEPTPRTSVPPESPPDRAGERPSVASLLEDFGDEYLSIQALFRFCYLPAGRLSYLKELAVDERWGNRDFALLKYLAVHLRLAVEQGCYLWNEDQLIMTAGDLTTKTGAPIYLGISANAQPEGNPWVVNWVGERPSTQALPESPGLGHWADLVPSLEIIVACELDHPERRVPMPGFDAASPVAKTAAIAGAITWAIHRGLATRQIHSGGKGYFIPVYLGSREDLHAAPDFVAPLVVQEGRGIVRAVLSPQNAYAPARAVVQRCEELPPWLLGAWEEGDLSQEPQPSDA